MGIKFSTWLTRPFILRTLAAQARLALRLLREPRVPMVAKAVPVLAALYLISPLDVVPDFLPALGQLDDLGVIIAALELFVRLSPSSAQAFHREAMAQRRRYTPMASNDDFIEAQWRHG
jgi:uncharacterized membrane protein YkvA (DUF1232 family)